jgi:hypothetical protein
LETIYHHRITLKHEGQRVFWTKKRMGLVELLKISSGINVSPKRDLFFYP